MERLKDLRKANKISQQGLSNEIGVSRSTIAMWETGKSEPANDDLNRIADFFGVSLDYLLGRSNIKNIAEGVSHAVEVLSSPPDKINASINQAFKTKKSPVESDKGDRPAMEREYIDLLSQLTPDSLAELQAFMSLSPEQRKAVLALAKATIKDKE